MVPPGRNVAAQTAVWLAGMLHYRERVTDDGLFPDLDGPARALSRA